MTTWTMLTTCSGCGLTMGVRSTSLDLALPAPGGPPVEPTVVHICRGCQLGDAVRVPWRTATYLLEAGATTVTEPPIAQLAQPCPEQRPAVTTPMTLDDLIDLIAFLDANSTPGRSPSSWTP